MGKPIMLQGTMSNVGKSMLAVGLCRAFVQDGYSVAPFCGQSMEMNTYITKEGKEISKMQAIQAEAAKVLPQPCMNPILLKPTENQESRIIINGELFGDLSVEDYLLKSKKFKKIIMDAYEEVSEKYDIVVVEGAGSPVEFETKSRDIVNMGFAKKVRAPVLLVGDIDQGGVMAQLLGTLGLFSKSERDLVKGILFNKFRGVTSSLNSVITHTERKGHVPVLGVMPYLYSLWDMKQQDKQCGKKGRTTEKVEVAVIKLPNMPDFLDFNPWECFDEVDLKYVSTVYEIGNPDIIMIPDTTKVYEDLMWIRQNGLEAQILQFAAKGTVIFGICAGMKMLSETLDVDEIEHIYGMGLLPLNIVIDGKEEQRMVDGTFECMDGIFSELSYTNFQDGMLKLGKMTLLGECKEFLTVEEYTVGFQKENVYGICVRQLFNTEKVIYKMIYSLLKEKGKRGEKLSYASIEEYRDRFYDHMADVIRQNIDIDQLYEIIKNGC